MTTTTPVTSSLPTSATQNTIDTSQKSLISDQQTFLTLLTAQLKNQDPLSPMDPSQFTQQLVQMTGVQQQILTNQLLQKMSDNGSSLGDPVSLIGKTVTATTDTTTLASGKADWLYSLDGQAANVKLVVKDSQGRVVYSATQTAQAAGEHPFSWDGKDLLGNQKADGGSYTLSVTAQDATGADVTSKTYQRGIVTSVEQSNGVALLNVNGAKIAESAITAVT